LVNKQEVNIDILKLNTTLCIKLVVHSVKYFFDNIIYAVS
jgi:hypothetical protein